MSFFAVTEKRRNLLIVSVEGRNRSEEHDTVSFDKNLDVNRTGMYTHTIESLKYKV